ncbi:helix-turn-helix domain-containing protein [Yersinia kristensenii]|uniref:Transcriptional regulator n=1 Tax=Yersinia kristensenii TaxID=28152 RepID=A0AB73NXY0_YERKR|nr:helix-turn-helix transcriptional regulator [Yersinia kristensenii]OVZ80926.1 transcriptional regulator [Yersinia kristensenii]HEM6612769.1 helix-turn-helix transcriptional regulator [Yersinia enterocolitica]HEM6616770.1 helix-turn-helix transcriptional regulator [Yersinia enterocolitica]HEM6616861.1 helix-turn-helix transcriptional regulator [Yersinia enterocolitica]
MALTEFGKAVRIARIETGHTLLTMAEELGASSAFLSGLETGSKKIPRKWVKNIQNFFEAKGYKISNLQELADVSNESVPLDGLSQQQKMLVAGFAKSPWTPQQLKKFAELLEKMNR